MLAVDEDEQRSCSGLMGASAVSSSSGIARIVKMGVAYTRTLTAMMEREQPPSCRWEVPAMQQWTYASYKTSLFANYTVSHMFVAKVGHHTHCGCEILLSRCSDACVCVCVCRQTQYTAQMIVLDKMLMCVCMCRFNKCNIQLRQDAHMWMCV